MSWINPFILFGLGLAVIPVLLHFLMKAKPKKLMFPALRLIQNRRKTNSQRMKLKHFWLLLLRAGLIGLMVMAMARPSLPAANYGLSLREWLTLIGIGGSVAGVYWWLTRKWKRDQLPVQTLATRVNTARTGSIIGALLLALLLVLWPYSRRVAAEAASPLQSVAQDLPVAAVFLLDVSSSMDYKFESQTRLEVAKSIAKSHLETLPQRSRIAVTSNSGTGADVVFQADLMSAQSRIEDLKSSAMTRPFNERIKSAIELQTNDRERTISDGADDRDQFVREVYVFTDLTRPAWNISMAEKLRTLVAENDWMHIYLIDVGVLEPINSSVRQIKLSQQSISEGGRLMVEANVTSVGRSGTEQAVEVYVMADNGDSVKQGQAVVAAGEQDSLISFPLQGLKGPVRQGEVRLVSTDPLAADDIQYFTVNVTRPVRLLLIGENENETNLLRNSLEVTQILQSDSAVYDIREGSLDTLSTDQLAAFDIVCLVSPRQPTEVHWKTLSEFVSKGGGLAVYAGHKSIQSESWDSAEAGEVLPAALRGPRTFFKGPFQIDAVESTHPVMKPIEETVDGTSMLADVEFYRAWIVDPLPDAKVIAVYNNEERSPAILERRVGQGRVVLFTTSANLPTRDPWSDLPNHFAFIVLNNSILRYLSHQSEDVFNYVSGQSVLVRLDPERPFERYLVRKPGFQQLPGEVPKDADVLTLTESNQPGHYEVVSLDQEQERPFRVGYSVNLPSTEADLTRLGKSELDALLGEERYSVARQIQELDRVVSDRRVGREIFPLLLMIAITFFCGEHIVANWFYSDQQEPVAA